MRVASLMTGWMLVFLGVGSAFGARVGLVVERAGEEVTVSYPTWPGDSAKLERSTDLRSWSEVAVLPVPDNRRGEKRRIENGQPAFYRVKDSALSGFEGKVVDAATYRPVTNANAGLFPTGRTFPVLVASTDESGFFSLRIPSSLQNQLTTMEIAAPGFELREASGFFRPGHADYGKTFYLVPLGLTPANDAWSNAVPLGLSLAATGNTAGATLEIDEPDRWQGLRSLWWKWIPTRTGAVRVDTSRSETLAYPHIYVGSRLESLVQIWSSIDRSTEFWAEAGQTYYVRIGTRTDYGGPVQFQIQEFPPTPPTVQTPASEIVGYGQSFSLRALARGTAVLRYQWRKDGVDLPSATNATYTVEAAQLSDYGVYTVRVSNIAGEVESGPATISEAPITNDHFAQATPLLPLDDFKIGANRVATLESGEPLAFPSQTGRTVWYRWLPTRAGPFAIDTRGSAFDTALAVYAGTELTNLTLVASNDNVSSNDVTSALVVEAIPDQIYYIAVDGMGGAWGALRINLRPHSENVPGPIPTSLAGKGVVFDYGRFRELFEFTSDTTGIYHQGIDTFTYNYSSTNRRIVLRRWTAAGQLRADYTITLEFDPGSSNRGSAIVQYGEPGMVPATDPARFEFF
jgi:hypothetical protein